MVQLAKKSSLVAVLLFSASSADKHGGHDDSRGHDDNHGHETCPVCDVSLYLNTGFGTQPCTQPGIDFGCYPGEDSMWIRPPCGAVFRCNADHHDVSPDPEKQRGQTLRCGSRWFKPAPGQTRLNCTCGDSQGRPKHHTLMESAHEATHAKRASCGERASIDNNGGVTAGFRRLPMPMGENPAVKCCRNKPTGRGDIQWNVTLNFTQRDYAAWPSACEALCDQHPSGRCRFFSHSVRWQNCIICSECVAEIALGDDTYASFEKATEDPAKLYSGLLA